MAFDFSQFEKRKQDHIKLALDEENQASELNDLDKVELIHEAIPNLNFADISLRTKRLGQTVVSPFIVSSMTAGHIDAALINDNLISACNKTGWEMGVGSQRRELTEKNTFFEWYELRQKYPNVGIFSNLGLAQIINTPIKKITQLLESLKARALIIHCNPLQECIQPEGTPNFKGALGALKNLVNNLNFPVIVKETGCGFSKNTLERLNDIGVAAVDVSGLGGTHWGRIEGARVLSDNVKKRTSDTFRNWGISTVKATIMANDIRPKYEIWGSGGVRNGLDAAKLLALGANTVGFAKPMLVAALESKDAVVKLMKTIEYELKVAMFCTGSANVNELKEKA